MSKPLYFNADAIDKDDDEARAMTLDSHRDAMLVDGLPEVRLYRAHPDKTSGVFWCREFQWAGDVGVGCGKACDSYAPRNGKKGRCRHSAHCYEPDVKDVKVIRAKQAEPAPRSTQARTPSK